MPPLNHIVEIAAEVLDLPVKDIDVDTPVYELGIDDAELHLIIARAAERNGRTPSDLDPPYLAIHDTVSLRCIEGLRELALVLPAARKRFARYVEVLYVNTTLRSWATSIEVGHFVPSEPAKDPRAFLPSPFGVAIKYAGLFGAAYYIPVRIIEPHCRPLCDGHYDFSLWDLSWLPPAAILAVVLYLIFQFGPALRDLLGPPVV